MRRRPDTVENAPATFSTPQQTIPVPETDNRRAQTEASSLSVSEQEGGRRTDMAQAGETVSRPLGLRPLQNTLEREERDVETRTTGGNSKAAPSQRGKLSTVPGTASGTVSKEGSQQDYLKNLPRHERRRIEQEMRRKRKPGKLWIIYLSMYCTRYPLQAKGGDLTSNCLKH